MQQRGGWFQAFTLLNLMDSAQTRKFSAATVRESKLYDFAHHLLVGATGFFGGHIKLRGTGEPGIGISFNHIHLAFLCDPHIDSAIVSQSQSPVSCESGAAEQLYSLLIEVC